MDVVLLQEIWTPSSEIVLPNFRKPLIRLRGWNNYGGVAVLVQNGAKVVHRKELEVNGLEAIWVEIQVNKVKILFASVYINVGKIDEIALLDKVLEKVLENTNCKVMLGMDANLRS